MEEITEREKEILFPLLWSEYTKRVRAYMEDETKRGRLYHGIPEICALIRKFDFPIDEAAF